MKTVDASTRTRTELVQLLKCYQSALDDLAYLFYINVEGSSNDVLETNLPLIDDINSKVLIATAMVQPPMRLVKDAKSKLQARIVREV